MKLLTADDVRAALPWPELIEAIEAMFRRGATTPHRQVLPVENPAEPDGLLLLMPSWIGGDTIGVKAVTFFPGNREQGLSTISAAYLLFDGRTGQIRAACDGDEITARRTAATSAAAAKRLARADAAQLLVIGTGQLSANMAQAHAAVRAYRSIEIHGRDRAKAEVVAQRLVALGLPAAASADLAASAARADVISCATNAGAPVLKGAWLKPGAHVDLVGGFKDDMREADDAVITRASLFVDERREAMLAGDLSQPLRAGLIRESDIRADFRELVSDLHAGRASDDEITLFKSVGHGLEDLAAGKLIGSRL